MISCGKYHTLFLIDGHVWATGHNTEGQIGIGNTDNQYRPVQLQSLNDVVSISAWHSSACINKKGDVHLWGTNQFTKPNRIQNHTFTDVKVGGNFTLLSDADGHIMQTSSGAQPHYVQGIEENLAQELCVGGNFAFVIGKALLNDESQHSP